MEKVGFYEGPGYFSSEGPDVSTFMKIRSVDQYGGDLLKSPLHQVNFDICDDETGVSLRNARYQSLYECLEKEAPERLLILQRNYDILIDGMKDIIESMRATVQNLAEARREMYGEYIPFL